VTKRYRMLAVWGSVQQKSTATDGTPSAGAGPQDASSPRTRPLPTSLPELDTETVACLPNAAVRVEGNAPDACTAVCFRP